MSPPSPASPASPASPLFIDVELSVHVEDGADCESEHTPPLQTTP
jgi:hypothetical protein